MRHRTIHERTARWILAVAGTAAAVVAIAGASIDQASAQPSPFGDPLIPDPSRGWCPGGGTSNYYGAYCEGLSYADGTRWNYYRTGWYWQPGPRCIVENSGVIPVLAPNGCGTSLR